MGEGEGCAHTGPAPRRGGGAGRGRDRPAGLSAGDPDRRVSGRGFAALAAAGIAVETGLMAAEARRLNAGFLSVVERRRPHLTLKLAATLDGRIATAAGESRWITGAPARTRAHLMRAQADAVLIGAGTARADDPMLDVRGLGPRAARPVRLRLGQEEEKSECVSAPWRSRNTEERRAAATRASSLCPSITRSPIT